MQINRPSSLTQTYTAQTDTTPVTRASAEDRQRLSQMTELKDRLTPRSEDYLSRLRTHGTDVQKSMASAVSFALSTGSFVANPARDKPVSQFGLNINLEGARGILLANFMPHDEKLELVALAFRAERFFDTEANGVEIVILECARALPEVNAQRDKNNATVTLKFAESRHAAQGDAAAEYKALKEEIKRYNSQSMYRLMASKLADMRVSDGRSGSRLTALPAAHATVLGATIRKLTVSPVQLVLGSHNLSQSQQDNIPKNTNVKVALKNPSGLQYQFQEQEFVDFNDNQLLRSPTDISMTVKNPAAQNASNESSRSSVVTAEKSFYPASAKPFLLQRRGQIISEDLQNQLQDLLVASRRHGQLVKHNKIQELNELIAEKAIPDKT